MTCAEFILTGDTIWARSDLVNLVYDSKRKGSQMLYSFSRNLAALLLAIALVLPLMLTGCRNREGDYYNRWEHETHREHVDLDRRPSTEQKEYRDWRERQDHH